MIAQLEGWPMSEKQQERSFALQETKVYRFNLAYRLYHCATGAAALVCAAWWYHFLVLSVVLALFGAFMVSRLIFTKVIVNQYSVVLKGMFSEGSLQRSSITAIERKHTGRSNFLILWGNLDEKENLTIADVFAFDKAWDDWLSTFRDLSHDKPLSLF
jgi:hypothetical protein